MARSLKIAVVPAAGKGLRMTDLHLTKILPKVMLPLLNRPILEYVIQTLGDLKVEEIFLVVGYKKDVIKDYFGNGQEFGVKINYVEQPIPLGIADAIGRARDFINDPFIVVLGDSFFLSHNLDALVKMFWEKRALAVEGIVFEKSLDSLKRACNVVLDNEKRITAIFEKPDYPTSSYRGIGTYIFDPKVFDYIDQTPVGPPRGEREITNTIRLMASTKRVYAGMIKGVEINVNTYEDLMAATILLLKREKKRK